MQIISHRGIWGSGAADNSEEAIFRSFRLGIGTEMDVRDKDGRLVLSHGLPVGNCAEFEKVVKWCKDNGFSGCLALDVKSCGLASELSKIMDDRGNYFFFGMPLPEMLEFREQNLTFFTRESEYEREPLLYADAKGVWLDLFDSDDDLLHLINKNLENGKVVCIVSAELNGRPCQKQWELLK